MKYLKLFENFNKNEYKNIIIGKGPRYDTFVKEFAKLNNKNILPIYINGTDSNEIRGGTRNIHNQENSDFELSTNFSNNPNRNYTWPEVIYTYKNLDASHKDVTSDEIANITSGYLFFDFEKMNLCLQETEYPESFLFNPLKEWNIDFDTNKLINQDKSIKTRQTLKEILVQCGLNHIDAYDKDPLMSTYFENAQKTGVLNPGDLDHYGYFKIISVE